MNTVPRPAARSLQLLLLAAAMLSAAAPLACAKTINEPEVNTCAKLQATLATIRTQMDADYKANKAGNTYNIPLTCPDAGGSFGDCKEVVDPDTNLAAGVMWIRGAGKVNLKANPPICATALVLTAPGGSGGGNGSVPYFFNISQKAQVSIESIFVDCQSSRPGILANSTKMLTLEKLQVVNCVSHWCPVPRPIARTADNGNSTSRSNTSSTACGGGLTLLSSSATLNTVAFKNNSAYYIRAPDDPPEVEEGEGWGGGIFVSAGQLYTPPGKQVKYYSGTAIKATTVAVNGNHGTYGAAVFISKTSPAGVTVSFKSSAIRNNLGPNCTAIASVRYDQKGVLKLVPGSPLSIKLNSGNKATAFTGNASPVLCGWALKPVVSWNPKPTKVTPKAPTGLTKQTVSISSKWPTPNDYLFTSP